MLMPTVMEHVGELYCFLVLSFVNIQTVFSCEQVTMPMCVDLDYNMTKFPNFLGHQNIMDANLELHTFYPLVKVKCSPYLQEFLCRVYAPECDPNNPDGPLKVPIYSLCQSAKGGCGSVMNKFGFPWPERLQCEKFLETSTSTTVAPTKSIPFESIWLELNVQYTTTPITFLSCCRLYSFPKKVLRLFDDAMVQTADIRQQPKVTWKRTHGMKNQGGYFTMIIVTSDDNINKNGSFITNWLLTNKPVGLSGDWTTVKEYQGPIPTKNRNTVHFLLYLHENQVDVASVDSAVKTNNGQYGINLVGLTKSNKMKLVGRKRVNIEIDVYARFKWSYSKSDVCKDVPGYTEFCDAWKNQRFLLKK